MDLVTITDHDSIQGCIEFLDAHPVADFFVSEEVSCWFPDSTVEVHFGVYGMTEALHRAIQPLRGNAFEMAAALRGSGVVFSLNHLLHFYQGQVPMRAYLRLLGEVPALETRNGTMLRAHNDLVTWIAGKERGAPSGGTGRFGQTGGSDAHTLRRIGRTWTEAAGSSVEGFLQSLATGQSVAAGAHGTTATVAADAYGVIRSYVASVIGVGLPPGEHGIVHRLACLLFTLASLPAQFLPYTIAASGKFAEARQVRRVSAALERELDCLEPWDAAELQA